MNKRELARWLVERHNARHPNCNCDRASFFNGPAPSLVIIDDVIQQNKPDSRNDAR